MPAKGGVSVPVFECIFNGATSITSYTRSFDQTLYELLDNLYVVLISKNTVKREIVAGFFIKTSLTHNDGEDFQDVLEAALITSQNLSIY